MEGIKTIAVTGKGGTGKTMLATLMLKVLTEQGRGTRILVIDADSASSLPYTLGIDVRKTVSDMRNELVGYQQAKKQLEDRPIREVMRDVLEPGNGFDLLTMGRSEEPGCYCAVNDLLKYAIDALIRDYDVVIIDGEAGPEQLNRRVLSNIDVLLVLSDGSLRSMKTAQSIIHVAQTSKSLSVDNAQLVLNRFKGDQEAMDAIPERFGIEVIGSLPEDEVANEYDRDGKPLLELPDDSPMLEATRAMLRELVPDLMA